jgi:hypothetical protein
MINPSMTVLVLGTIVMALLLAADWYVWGMTYATNSRRTVRPRGTGEPTTGDSTHDDRHGFKQVA